MPTFEIICLANSSKPGGRCIAGLRTDGSGWLRPVSDVHGKSGVLYLEHYLLDNGKEPQPFDIIKIDCIKHYPECYQPENWLISQQKWKFVCTLTLDQVKEIILPEVSKHLKIPKLLGDSRGSIRYDDLNEFPAQSSLALIKPDNIQWQVSHYWGKRKFRARFNLVGVEYDLPITDIEWNSKLDQLGDGSYSCKDVIEKLKLENFDPDRFFLTISLGAPFYQKGAEDYFCYKLIAAVINSSEVKKRLELN